VPVLAALAQAARDRKALPDGGLTNVTNLIPDSDAALSVAAIRLAAAWKLESARHAFKGLAAKDPGERGRAAIDALVALGGKESIDALEELQVALGSKSAKALAGLATLDPKQAAPLAAAAIVCYPSPTLDPSEVYLAFLRRAGGADLLAKEMKK